MSLNNINSNNTPDTMSTKSTIFLTRQNEHCYIEHAEYDKSGENPIYLEIDASSIFFFDRGESGELLIGIKGSSQLAKILQKLSDIDEDSIK